MVTHLSSVLSCSPVQADVGNAEITESGFHTFKQENVHAPSFVEQPIGTVRNQAAGQ